MNLLPEKTYLGILKIIEVYEGTDEPCLFACRNASGHIFLSVLIDETEAQREWLYVPLSPDRFTKIRSGEIDVQDGFRSAEDGFVHSVTVPIYEGSAIVGIIHANNLTNEMLPLKGSHKPLLVQQGPSIDLCTTISSY
jgi:hypothetical protein